MRSFRFPRASTATPRLLLAAVREVARADGRGTAAAATYHVLAVTAALGVVAAGKVTFDALLQPGRAMVSLPVALLALATATAVSGAIGPLQAQQHRVLGERVSQRVWDRLIDTTTRAKLISYEAPGFLTSLERVQQSALTRPFAVTTSLFGLGGGLLGVVTLAAALAGIEPLLVPILIAAGVPAVLLARWASRSEFAFARRMTTLYRRRTYFRDLLTKRPYAAELRAFGADRMLRARHRELDDAVTSELRRQVRRRQLIAALAVAGVAAAVTAALLAIVQLLRSGRIDLPQAGAAAIAVRLLSGQLATMFTALGGLIESLPFLDDLRRFVASVPERDRAGRALPLDIGVALRGASFRYPEQDRPAVDNVDIEIGAGEVVALVGENGSGKTTIAKIIAGLYEPTDGARLWDHAPAAPVDVKASVTAVFQDFVRYQMSLRDNVVIGDGARPEDEAGLPDALRRVGALAVARELPDGFATMLGRDLDEGVDLSGGQWQQVALARAMYRHTPLVVLDEPTASLDARTEYELFRDVRTMLGGRAALLISHRFSSTRMADRIYVMDAGRVVESGTHDELIARAGRYAELYRLQSSAYR